DGGQYTGTRGELRARRILAAAAARADRIAWAQLRPVIAGVLDAVGRSAYGVAEGLVGAPLDAESASADSERAALRDFVREFEAVARRRLEAELDGLRAERRYNEAVQRVNGAIGNLTRESVKWAEERRRLLLEEHARFGAQRNGLLEAIARWMPQTEKGEWKSAQKILADAGVTGEFAELAARRDILKRALERAEAVTERVRAGLREHHANRRARPYLLRDPGGAREVRGTIERKDDIESFRFNLKHDGLTKTVWYAFRELDAETLRGLARDGGGEAASDEDVALLYFLLGELELAVERGGVLAALAAAPEWLPEAREYYGRWREGRRGELLEKGRVAHKNAESDLARDVYLLLESEYSDAELERFLPECRTWLEEYWRRDPLLAFPGIDREESAAEKDGDGYIVTLAYDFSKKLEQGSPIDDWKKGANSQLLWKDGTAQMLGSIRLHPSGSAEVFADHLEVVITLRARDIPKNGGGNLNLLLWAGLPTPSPRGQLFAHGFRPQKLASLWIGDREVLLPATVIGDVATLEAGRAASMDHLRPEPDPGEGQAYTLIARSNRSFSDFAIGKGPVIGGTVDTAYPDELRHGTVEIRTYNTPVQIRDILVKGRLQDAWWRAWVDEQIRADLARR
ncbi:MAG: hypothetical protein L0Z55_12475, partial [Planctomycetes bacterium]|nr:hypothetical protein [Planctomycetota bacterium]